MGAKDAGPARDTGRTSVTLLSPLTRWGRLRRRDLPIVAAVVPIAAWSAWCFRSRSPDHAVQAILPRRLLLAVPADPTPAIRAVGRATDVVLRKLPRTPAKCTINAATRACLLRAAGIDAIYVSGVDKSERHGLRFHAWVEHDGHPLYEVDDVSPYLPLLSYPERS